MKNLITRIDLTPAAEQAFAAWFKKTASVKVIFEPTRLEMYETFMDCACAGESYLYELRGFFTKSGNPAIFGVEPNEVTQTLESDV